MKKIFGIHLGIISVGKAFLNAEKTQMEKKHLIHKIRQLMV